MDEEGVLDFLTSLEAMDLPDRIEEVNAKILHKIIEDTDFVAVLFCEYKLCLTLNKSNFSFTFYQSIYLSIYFYYNYYLFILAEHSDYVYFKAVAVFSVQIKNQKPKIQLSSLVTKIHTT